MYQSDYSKAAMGECAGEDIIDSEEDHCTWLTNKIMCGCVWVTNKIVDGCVWLTNKVVCVCIWLKNKIMGCCVCSWLTNKIMGGCVWLINETVNGCGHFCRCFEYTEPHSSWLWPLVLCFCTGGLWLVYLIIRRYCSKNRHRLGGIPNIGATCYANSVFQVLGQTPGFMECLDDYSQKVSGQTPGFMECLDDYSQKDLYPRSVGVEHTLSLLSELTYKSVVDGHKVRALLDYIMQRDNSFSLGHQNDCHSFLLSLFNILKDEMQSGSLQLFEGKLCNRFSYNTCAHVEQSDVQMFNSLLIPVNMLEPRWSVEDGLKTLAMYEDFPNNILPCRTCERVGRIEDLSQTITTKRTVLTELPQILILQIARFQEVPVDGNPHLKTLKKIQKDVQYSKILDMSKFCDVHPSQYRLYAVIFHTGSLNGGHYHANVRKMKTDNWFYCSDSSVGSISYHDYPDSNAYVLCYEREPEAAATQ